VKAKARNSKPKKERESAIAKRFQPGAGRPKKRVPPPGSVYFCLCVFNGMEEKNI
jgi:hypothetical protein